MLGHLVSNAPRLIRPYMEPILKVTHKSWRDWHFCQVVWDNGSVSVDHFFSPRLRDKDYIGYVS